MWFPSRLQDGSNDRIQERGDECVRVGARTSVRVCTAVEYFCRKYGHPKSNPLFGPILFQGLERIINNHSQHKSE